MEDIDQQHPQHPQVPFIPHREAGACTIPMMGLKSPSMPMASMTSLKCMDTARAPGE